MADKESTVAPLKEAFLSAGEFLKYSLTLATGALVFSVELIKEDVSLPASAKFFLVVAWITLLASVIGGVLTFARFPVQIAASNYSLEDPFLVWPWRIHQLAFALGILSIGVTLIIALLSNSSTDASKPTTVNSECCLQHQGGQCWPDARPLNLGSTANPGLNRTGTALRTALPVRLVTFAVTHEGVSWHEVRKPYTNR